MEQASEKDERKREEDEAFFAPTHSTGRWVKVTGYLFSDNDIPNRPQNWVHTSVTHSKRSAL